MNMKQKRVALVTGSTRGIGLSIAIKLLKEGFFVFINGTSNEKLPLKTEEVLQKASDTTQFHYIKANIASSEERKKIIQQIKDVAGRIDLLVNNAGIAPRKRTDILDLQPEDYNRLLQINLEGPFFLTQEISKYMLELLRSAFIEDFHPMIINISSISAYTASINRSEYCISKAGLSMMTQLFASRLGDNILVYEIRPGIIETDMTSGVLKKYEKLIDEGLLPIKRIGKPDDIAHAVSAIVNHHFPYSTGNVFDIDGGFHLRRL